MSDAVEDEVVVTEAVVEAEARPPRWLIPLRTTVVSRRGGVLLWKTIVALLGAAVVVLGIVLLPLPGPGWAIIFAGMAIWATEFVWAQRLLRWARSVLRSWTDWLLRQHRVVQLLVGAVGLALLAVVLYVVYVYLL